MELTNGDTSIDKAAGILGGAMARALHDMGHDKGEEEFFIKTLTEYVERMLG